MKVHGGKLSERKAAEKMVTGNLAEENLLAEG